VKAEGRDPKTTGLEFPSNLDRGASRKSCLSGTRHNKAIPAEAGIARAVSLAVGSRAVPAPRLLLNCDCTQGAASKQDCRERQADPPCGPHVFHVGENEDAAGMFLKKGEPRVTARTPEARCSL
jgi:hypothetical protein